MQLWQELLAWLIVWNSIFIPLELSFDEALGGFLTVLDVFDACIDAFFWLDIALTFRTAYQVPETKVLVSDTRSIARHYFEGWFLIDVLATFPWDVGQPQLKGLKILRLLRSIRLFKEIKVDMSKNVLVSTLRSSNPHRMRMRARTAAGHSRLSHPRSWRYRQAKRVFSVILYFIFTAHWVACLWWAARLSSAPALPNH